MRTLAAALVVGLWLPAAAAAPSTRWVRSKPTHTEIGPHVYGDAVVVKFVQPARVRLRGGELVDLDERMDLDGVRELLQAHPAVAVSRWFERGEAELELERIEAERRSGKELGDLNLYYLFDLANAPDTDAEALIDALNAVSVVELARSPPRPVLPSTACDRGGAAPAAGPGDYESQQTHLDPAPVGIDAEWAWTKSGGQGSTVRFIDIELDWNVSHNDLPATFVRLPAGYSAPGAGCSGNQCTYPATANHGTACVGAIVAQDDATGTTGIAPQAQWGLCDVDAYHGGNYPNIANAINTAAAQLNAGDAILIELSAFGPSSGGTTSCGGNGQYGTIPMEYWQANFDAIAVATANGIVVVEPAANGEMDLDDGIYGGAFNPTLRNSGAILVGAGSPFGSHPPECFTTYGSRVDLYAYGGAIVTTGYGGTYPSLPRSCSSGADCEYDDLYTNGFGGTSGASAIITGAVAAMQGISEANYSTTLTPGRLRDVLKINATPQGSPTSRNIGVMPDLRGSVRAELRPEWRSGWTYPLVPRVSNDANCGYADLSATLWGNVATTYLNAYGVNEGIYETNSLSAVFYVDDVMAASALWPLGVDPGQYPCATNMPATTVRGGRHTLRVSWDDADQTPEWYETNNGYTGQFVWTPLLLGNDVALTRSAPPDRDTTGIVYYNSDGFEFRLPTGAWGWWGGVGMLPSAATDDYDLRLHDDYANSQTGFASYLEGSNWSAGLSDFVLANGNAVGPGATLYAAAFQGSDTPGSGGMTVEYDAGPSLSGVGTHGPLVLAAGEVLDVIELYFGPADTNAYYDFTLGNSGEADLGFSLFDASVSYASKSDHMPGAYADSYGVGSDESFSVRIDNPGLYGLVVWKYHASDLPLASDYLVTVAATPPNLAPRTPSGWSYPVLARDTTGCSGISCSVTATLPGGTPNSWLNYNGANIGLNPAGSLHSAFSLDGEPVSLLESIGPIDPDDDFGAVDHGPFTVKGGRHTLGIEVDALDQVAETDEVDNTDFRQFVWSPTLLNEGVPTFGDSPPDRDSPGHVHYNCDGYSWVNGWWGATALLAFDAGTNYDVRLHDDYLGSQSGFEIPLEASTEPAGKTDFVMVNANHPSVPHISTFYSGVIQSGGVTVPGDYAIQHRNNRTQGSPVPGDYGPWVIPPHGLIDLIELYLDTPDVGRTFVFDLSNLGGGADLAFALYGGDRPHFRMTDALVIANEGGPGEHERIVTTIPYEGYYAVAVWKVGTPDLTLDAVYELSISDVLPYRPEPNTLRIERDPDPAFAHLTWAPDCNTVTSSDYSIYTGSLRNLRAAAIYDYSTAAPICNCGADMHERIPLPEEDAFFLIVPHDDSVEGSYGEDSSGTERPHAGGAGQCHAQDAAEECVL